MYNGFASLKSAGYTDAVISCNCPDVIVPLDVEQSFDIAFLKKSTKHKGLSIGDRACIALGIKMKLPIYTADKVWADLDLEGAEIILIRCKSKDLI